MDKNAYLQLDRIERNTNEILRRQEAIVDMDGTEILQTFYEEEIANKEGALHYLAKDEKLKSYFEELEIEEDTDNEEQEEEQEGEYSSKPF